jgi:site-specific recombinase XerC
MARDIKPTTQPDKNGPGTIGDIPAAPDVQSAVLSWRDWLEHERRTSVHTIDAYLRDLIAFLNFSAEHLGSPPDLQELASFRPVDFRWSRPHLDRARDVDVAKLLSLFGS